MVILFRFRLSSAKLSSAINNGQNHLGHPLLAQKVPLKDSTFVRFYAKREEGELRKKEERKTLSFFDGTEIDGFKVFNVYKGFGGGDPPTPMTLKADKQKYEKKDDLLGRFNKMPIDQDWTSVWPTNSVFKHSVVPLPVYQGYADNKAENDGISPGKFGNLELMKIPNFLHLTPTHIAKQCAAIKKFCTPWPKELEFKDSRKLKKTFVNVNKHFPVKITTSNYIYDSPSIRDDRARIVKLEIHISSLKLDERSKQKLITLAQHRYSRNTQTITIIADKCPYRRQNLDYAKYLLTALYHESLKIEEWESEMAEEDRPKTWLYTETKTSIVDLFKQIKPSENTKDSKSSEILNNYTKGRHMVLNVNMESTYQHEAYKKGVLDLLNIKNCLSDEQETKLKSRIEEAERTVSESS